MWQCTACERPLRLYEICDRTAGVWRGAVGLYGTCCCDCEAHRAAAAAEVRGTVVWDQHGWRGLAAPHRPRPP